MYIYDDFRSATVTVVLCDWNNGERRAIVCS